MNKKELANAVAEKADIKKKDAEIIVESVVESITEELAKGGKVQIYQFGNFEVRTRAARKGRNPQTGEEIEISETRVPAFKPAKALKDIVKGS